MSLYAIKHENCPTCRCTEPIGESSARPASSTPPVRALRLTFALEADTAKDMAHALIALADRIQRGEVTTGCWGSPSDGAIYELLADPTMTHDTYHQALREYLDSWKAASNAEVSGARSASAGLPGYATDSAGD